MHVSKFKNNLRIYRHTYDLSMKRVCKVLGYKDTSNLSRWERGHALPSVQQLFRLAHLYGVLPHELLEDLWKLTKNTLPQEESESE